MRKSAEEMFKEMMASGTMSDDRTDRYIPMGEELAEMRKTFVHIKNLEPGDKLEWKDEKHKDCKIEGNEGVLEVFRTIPIGWTKGDHGSNHSSDEEDFTVLAVRNGIYYEMALDSRRFRLLSKATV